MFWTRSAPGPLRGSRSANGYVCLNGSLPPPVGMCTFAGLIICSLALRIRCCTGRVRHRGARGAAWGLAASRLSDCNNTNSSVLLSNGRRMPVIGLGAAMPPQLTYEAVLSALKVGYRFVDTAQNYMNEVFVGRAVRDFLKSSGVSREDVFVSTKFSAVDRRERGFTAVLQAGRESCTTLGLDYIDRILLHSPHGGKLVETYDGLLELQQEGLVRCVGVSNFDAEHLEALAYYERPPPSVNQVEMHPLIYAQRASLVKKCQDACIQVEAFCPLLHGAPEFFMYGTLPELAKSKKRTPAQLLLRWAVQRGFTVVPKSTRMDRQIENMAVFDFELSDVEMQQLERMTGYGGQSSLVRYPEALNAFVDVGRVSARAMFSEQRK